MHPRYCRHLCRFLRSSRSRVLRLFPTDEFQIQHDEGIEDGNEQKRYESSDRQSPNLRIAKRLPKRAAMCSQRKQRNHCGRNRDHHWPQTKDAGIDQRQLQFLALFSSLLDKFKEHNDVAHNYTDEADDPKECHKSKGLAHNGERKYCTDNAVRNGSKDDQGFEGILELCEECQVNAANANEQHRSEISKAADLLFLLACEAEYEPVGKLLLECLQLWHRRCDYLRR